MNEFNTELSSALSKYNIHIKNILNNIEDFDIWYMKTFNTQFPKEWYTFIKQSNTSENIL